MSHPGEALAALPEDKAARYAELEQQILAVIAGETSTVARMASTACLLHHAFKAYFWTGFYLVDPEKKEGELVVGPYQGTMGCLRIPFGRGVCGAAAATRETQLVEDVHCFPGHIACDGNSRSEIVVPVFNSGGDLIAVLDVDSDQPAAFDDTDKQALERLMQKIFSEAS